MSTIRRSAPPPGFEKETMNFNSEQGGTFMNRKIFQTLTVLAAVLALVGGPLWAQAARGSVSGVVVDSSKAVVPGAEISLTNQGSGQVFTRISGESGAFSFASLIPELYTLRATLEGFQTYVAKDIKVNVGEDYTLTVTLQVGEVSQEVVVEAGTELVARSEAKISTTIGKEQIDNLPLNGRNPLNLITLNAGTSANSRTNTTIAGNRTSYTSISLDGVNIQDNFIRSNATDFVPARPTVSNVAEFTLTSSNQGSESGFGSNQVNLVTPTGSNNFHGSVFWYHRNSAAGANDFFNNRNGLPREQLIRNQFGFTVSGPVVKDKLLFFGFYEGQRIRQQTSKNTTVLTGDARQGIYTYLDNTGAVQKVNILQAAGISADPFITTTLGMVPTTINNFDNGDSSAALLRNTAGYSFLQASNNDRNQYQFRLDYILNGSHSFEGSYQALENRDLRSDIDNTFNATPIVTSGTGDSFSDFFSTAWKWTISPTLLNEVRFGGFLSPVVFDTAETFAPGFKIDGGTVFTNPIEDFEDQGRNTDTWTLQDNASWQRGAHSFRFGYQSNYIRVRSFVCFDCTPAYGLGLSQNQTIGLASSAFPGGIGSSDLGAANNLLASLGGLLSTGTQDFVVVDRNNPVFEPASDVKNWEYDTYALYFGDTWRFSPRLTMNLGVRWEYSPNLKEKDNLIVQVIPQSGQSIFQALLDPNAVYDFISGSLVNKDLNNFAPNVGFAWDLFGDSKTVLRAGYGISYVNDEAIRSTDTWLNRFGVSETSNLSGLTSSVSGGLPALTVPTFELPLDLPTIAARNLGGKGTFAIDPDIVIPYVQTWNLGIQREIGWDTAFEARYVGTKGSLLRRGVDLNQVDIFTSGFLADFLRARSNGFLAEAATGRFDPRYNENIPGSQPLTVFPLLPGGGILTNVGTIQSRIRQGRVGDLAYIYVLNNLTGNVPLNANVNANFADVAVNQASSSYHSLQLEVRRRFKAGLLFNANYTFSKVLTDAGGVGQTNFEPFTDINNPGYDRGRADFDLTHGFNANFIYELPFGRGRKFNIDNGILNQLAGGWNITSIFQYQSGPPFSIVSARGTLNRDGRSGLNQADSNLSNSQVRDLLGIVESGGNIYFVNPSVTTSNGRAVQADGAQPFAGQVFFNPEPGTLGNLPKNGYNGANYFNWDFGVLKTFPLVEDFKLEFRAEFFNFLNHNSFFVPDTYNINGTTFGQISSSASSPRVVQFALKLTW